jgi:hypothetical protein
VEPQAARLAAQLAVLPFAAPVAKLLEPMYEFSFCIVFLSFSLFTFCRWLAGLVFALAAPGVTFVTKTRRPMSRL